METSQKMLNNKQKLELICKRIHLASLEQQYWNITRYYRLLEESNKYS